MHLLQVGFTLGTLLAVSQPGAAVPASSVALRRGDDVCSMPFNNGDPETAKKTWNDSGAATWFENFLKEKGVTDWSNNFFKAIIAGGTQGGSTYDCSTLNAGTCDGPESKACTSYNPPETFYVHIAIANLNSALNELYVEFTTKAVSDISDKIHTITKEWGTPPKDEMPTMFSNIAAMLTTLVGIDGTVGSMPENKKPPGGGKFGGPMVVLSGITSLVNNNYEAKDQSPTEVQDDLAAYYAGMFDSLVGNINSTAYDIFTGKNPDAISEALSSIPIHVGIVAPPGNNFPTGPTKEGWLVDYFKDGAFLDWTSIEKWINAWRENTSRKMLELTLIRAMQTENKHTYRIHKYGKGTQVAQENPDCIQTGFNDCGAKTDLTEGICTGATGCIWYKDNCVCLGQDYDGTAFQSGPFQEIIPQEDFDKIKGWIGNFDEAMKNGFDCDGGDPNPPPQPDFENMPEYYPCFWNLETIDMTSSGFGGGIAPADG